MRRAIIQHRQSTDSVMHANRARRRGVVTAMKRINLYLLIALLPTMLVLFVVGCGGGKY